MLAGNVHVALTSMYRLRKSGFRRDASQIFLDRQSVIVLSMGFVVSFSAVLLTLRSVIDITTREDKGSIFAISSFCGDD